MGMGGMGRKGEEGEVDRRAEVDGVSRGEGGRGVGGGYPPAPRWGMTAMSSSPLLLFTAQTGERGGQRWPGCWVLALYGSCAVDGGGGSRAGGRGGVCEELLPLHGEEMGKSSRNRTCQGGVVIDDGQVVMRAAVDASIALQLLGHCTAGCLPSPLSLNET